MSYSILYRVAFLKLSDNTYIPVGESGDNNVYDCDRRRRSRDWSSGWGILSDKFSYTAQEIESRANEAVAEILKQYEGEQPSYENHAYTREEILKNFTYFSGIHVSGRSNTTAGEFVGWFRRGIRNAHTTEELRGFGIRISVYAYLDTGSRKEYVSSETELRDAFDRMKAEGLRPYVRYSDFSDYTYRLLCPKTGRKERTKAYVVRLDDGRYLVKNVAHCFRLSFEKEYAHRYPSAGATNRVVAALRRSGYPCTVEECPLTKAS